MPAAFSVLVTDDVQVCSLNDETDKVFRLLFGDEMRTELRFEGFRAGRRRFLARGDLINKETLIVPWWNGDQAAIEMIVGCDHDDCLSLSVYLKGRFDVHYLVGLSIVIALARLANSDVFGDNEDLWPAIGRSAGDIQDFLVTTTRPFVSLSEKVQAIAVILKE